MECINGKAGKKLMKEDPYKHIVQIIQMVIPNNHHQKTESSTPKRKSESRKRKAKIKKESGKIRIKLS